MRSLNLTNRLFTLLLCSCFLQAGAQGNRTDIVSKLKDFASNRPTEKAYLQFDKPYYAAGDTVFFKAYVTSGEQHRLSTLSGLLHIDLVNNNGKIDQFIKLKLDSGVAWGDFALPDSLPSGNYRIRAWTNWMRNDPGSFFEKVIPVGSVKAPARVPESLVKQPSQTNLKPDLQFFPEGGSLVEGIKCKVAFKAVGSDGLGMDVKGVISDNDGKQVTAFVSSHLGMGYFELTAAEGKTYSAKVTYANGLSDVVSLPKAEASGIVLSVNDDSIPKATVGIIANKSYFDQNKGKDYTLLIYSGGMITTVNCKLDSSVIKLDVLKRKLHTGVATITLFSSNNEPLCERLLFIQNYDRLNLNISSTKETYSPREKVNISLNVKNRADSAAMGHFSVSVIDESKVPDNKPDADNILTYLLLTSDLKGHVEQPGYYFSDTTTKVRNDLDLLMLTQGYRRFTWKQVFDATKQNYGWLPEKGINIEGNVRSILNKPVRNGTITLISTNKGPIQTATTDDKGEFRFSNLMFSDTARFVLSAVNDKNKNNTRITWNNDQKNVPVVQPMANFQKQLIDTSMAAFLNNDRKQQTELLNYGVIKGRLLKEVTIKARKPDNQYRTTSLAGAGNADQVMHAEEIEEIQGPLSLSLDGRLRGLTFVGTGLAKVPYLTLSFMSAIGKNPAKKMLVVIDGAYVEPEDINLLNSADVETVELLKYASASIYGVQGAGGVLIITTKQRRGLNEKDIVSKGILPITVIGFYKAREFYSPKYDNTALNTSQQDFRSTIFWKPDIKTDRDGNAAFDFYNADGTGTYKVTIEGIDNEGNIGRQVYRYKVE